MTVTISTVNTENASVLWPCHGCSDRLPLDQLFGADTWTPLCSACVAEMED
jgi:hypothetical protein